MIEKERLEELIEQGAIIYAYNPLIRKTIIKVRLNKYIFFYKNRNKALSYWLDKELETDRDVGYLEELFETKEDAEEYAEFGNITIIERLELPNWKEFLKQETAFMFKSKTGQIISLFKDDNTIYIEDENWNILRKSLTRENYNEARRICVKLFKGEEV